MHSCIAMYAASCRKRVAARALQAHTIVQSQSNMAHLRPVEGALQRARQRAPCKRTQAISHKAALRTCVLPTARRSARVSSGPAWPPLRELMRTMIGARGSAGTGPVRPLRYSPGRRYGSRRSLSSPSWR